jgi:putative endopeptidase
MNKTKKIKRYINNIENKYNECLKIIPNSYEPFEKDFMTNKESSNHEKEIIHMINQPFTSKNIQPNNDFYDYINLNSIKALKKTYKNISKKKKYYVQVDDFRIVQDRVNLELLKIIKDEIKNPVSEQSKNIKKVFTSLNKSNDKIFKQHVDDLLYKYNTFVINDDLWGLLSYINKNEIIKWLCPINWTVDNDLKHKNKFVNTIGFPSFPLYDATLYFFYDLKKENTIDYKNKKKIIEHYLKYIDQITNACLEDKSLINSRDCYDVQKDIILAMGCNTIKNDSDDFYNVVKREDAEKYNFNWDEFSKGLGYKEPPSHFICDSLNYLKCVCDTLKTNWKTPKWRSFWLYLFLRQMIMFNTNLRYIYYNFNRKILLGQPEMQTYEMFSLVGMSYCFNYFLSKEYVKHFYNPQTINYVKGLFGDLIEVFKRIISSNKWLSDTGKKNALLKLNYIKLDVGNPNYVRYDPILNYTDNDAWGNMLLLSYWRTNKLINIYNSTKIVSDYDIPSIDWKTLKLSGKQCYIVNSFYMPNKNEVYIPLAYIQKPFIDLNNTSIEYIMSYIGSTLTHEMSHSLDNNGSKFNYKGEMYDIFTKEDKKTYMKIQNDIIYQYKYLAKKDNYNLDASNTIGEDMADISGLAITIQYLRDFYIKNKYETSILKLSLEKFFSLYAISQKEFIYKKAIYNQLLFNPHPMNKYRVNVPLSRSELFRNIYKVKKNNGMWWRSLSKIWSD